MNPASRQDPTPASTPLTRRRFLGALGGGAALTTLAAACSGTKHRRPSSSSTSTAARTSPSTAPGLRKVRVGYIAEITGVNSARGELVKAAFDAMEGHINGKLGGSYHGVALELVPADAPHTVADAQQAYANLVGRVDAIVWCTPFGLAENAATIAGGSVPVVSVMADLQSYVDGNVVQLTGPGAKGSMIFQTALPDADALDVMLAYVAEDRGFASAGFLFDTAAYPRVGDVFAHVVARRGLTTATFSYDSLSGHVDLNRPLQALKLAKAQVIIVYGLADQASTLAAQLQTLDAKYVDTPTAKRSFKPMVMGSRWSAGDPSYARLAGEAAARGTLSPLALGSILTLPALPVRAWLSAYRPDYNGGFPQGGEDGPADAAALILDAVVRSGSTRAADLVTALESGRVTTFASSVGVSFSPSRHLAVGRDDTALLSLEFPPTSYNLGAEWREVLPKGYTGPTHLVDFTLAANTRAHPETVQELLQRRYGTSAGDDYQGGDRSKVLACKSVH
jgi:ABC-type branched-subunit amino acid transport system substrate-binding protein